MIQYCDLHYWFDTQFFFHYPNCFLTRVDKSFRSKMSTKIRLIGIWAWHPA